MRTTGARGLAMGLVIGLAMSTAAAGCKSDPECSADDDCPAQNACVANTCVARVSGAGYTAAVELEPPAESPHARRDYPAVIFTAVPAALELDRRVSMHAVLVPAIFEPRDRRTSVEVAFTLPSLLTGRPEISLNGSGVNQEPGLQYDTRVGIPERWLGRAAKLRVLPDMPADLLLCPWQLDVMVQAELTVPLPGDSDTVRVEGTVFTPTPDAAAPVIYEARLFAGNRLVSNVARTDATTGKFMLRAQKQVLEGRSDAKIEIAQADFKSPSTSLILPFAGESTNLGEVKFPPTPQPIAFIVPVYAAQSQGGTLKTPVVGASVRFSTRVVAASAEVYYVRTAQTGAEGTATIPLLPGSGSDTRDYVVSVVPPADSPSGSMCVPQYFVGAPVANNRVAASIFLPRKAVLTGQIRRFDQHPAPRMSVVATRIDASFQHECGTTLASPPTGTTADDDGNYQLLLDPGDYLVELEPPDGAGLPRHVLPTVTVTAPLSGLDVDLPEGVLVEGKVLSPSGEAAGLTRVRVFPTSGGSPLLGSTLTGPDGRFRLVLPRLP